MTLMTLEFAGQLSPWVGLALALLFAGGAWMLYRRETRRSGRFPYLLPLVRVIVVAMIILMLTGPTLRARSHVGEPGRIIVFVDASQSMTMTDDHMEIARKLLIARSQGWLSPGAIDTSLYDVAEAMRDARLTVEEALAGRDRLDLDAVARRFQEQLTAVHARLAALDLDVLPTAASVGTGTILREYWLGVPGERLLDLISSPRFTGPPTGTHSVDLFEAPMNLGDQYGTRMRGYVHPPIDGLYTFWISSDGPSELRLSSDEDPAGARPIAAVAEATRPRQWQAGESQSPPIRLVGGRRYYIEAIHKEDDGQDHLAVGWQLPVGSVERPIPGRRLSPFAAITGNSPAQQRDAIVSSFQLQTLAPFTALLAASEASDAARLSKAADLAAIAATVRRWETTLKNAFELEARARAEAGDPAITKALSRLAGATRWQRLSAMLLGDEGVVKRLADQHDISIYGMKDQGAELLWSSSKASRPPAAFELDPSGGTTDLTVGLNDRVPSASAAGDAGGGAGRTSVIVLSDGQHNVERSDPQAAAAILGQRRVPIHTVGFGSLVRPEDLSLRSVEGPQSVFHEDRVQGELVLDDDMPPGLPFTARIELDGAVVWEKKLVTERTNIRRVPFDFAIKELVEQQMAAARGEVKVLNVPLAFKATITPIEGESEQGNNTGEMTVHAVTEPRRMLIIDGRPRWETRYLRNLFTRDQRWQVNALIAATRSEGSPWRRGDEMGAFPRDLQSLFQYDAIIFGDVPAGLLTKEELQRLRDFTGERGGGFIFIDGQRGHLRGYAGTALAELLPVEWTGAHAQGPQPARLKLTASGQNATPLRLLSDPIENAALWQELKPPHWVAPARVLPGAELLAEAVVDGVTAPAIVQRSYGAGKVIYCAFDESWRWRYEVADTYHARFWNQITRWVAEQPYAVQDRFVKLDAGNPTYRPGEKAEIRARLRDRDGKPMLSAEATAQLYRDGRRIASIPLETGDGKGGSYHGQTPALEPGEYEVGLSVAGIADAELKARAKFSVEAPVSVERRAVIMDEERLIRMAAGGHGRYYREEDLPRLIERLEPLSQGRIVVTETALWRSYWWFVPIMMLLTVEWLLRKRAGML